MHKDIKVVPDTMNCLLNSEFSIFAGDGSYVLLASEFNTTDLIIDISDYPDWYDDCDVHSYKFFLVNMKTGVVSDPFPIFNENITLANNNGVSCYGYTFAILLRARQAIDIIQIVDGKLQHLYELGPHANEFYAATINEMALNEMALNDDSLASERRPLSHIKQRILVYLYKEVLEQAGTVEMQRTKLLQFYKEFSSFETMLMKRVQLIDSDTLLIFFEKRPLNRFGEIRGTLIVLYCLAKKTVFKVYEEGSLEFLYLMSKHYYNFFNAFSETTNSQLPPCNFQYFHRAFKRLLFSGDWPPKHFNSTLPLSPYLDYKLFHFDYRLILQLDEMHIDAERPLVFRDRLTGKVAFRLILENIGNNKYKVSQLVSLIFHPYEPFVISLQNTGYRMHINFHLYNPTTRVHEN